MPKNGKQDHRQSQGSMPAGQDTQDQLERQATRENAKRVIRESGIGEMLQE